jgi:hypothetical protein
LLDGAKVFWAMPNGQVAAYSRKRLRAGLFMGHMSQCLASSVLRALLENAAMYVGII